MTDINKRYLTVSNWNNHHDWPRSGGLRNLIFNRKKNGFDQFNVVKKIGKRVLIDEAAFFAWVDNQGEVTPLSRPKIKNVLGDLSRPLLSC